MMEQKDYNMIISNLILSKKEKFTFIEIRKEVEKEFGSDTEAMKTLSKCIRRMEEDGYLVRIGYSYKVDIKEEQNEPETEESLDELIQQMKDCQDNMKRIIEKIDSKTDEVFPEIVGRINKNINILKEMGFKIMCDGTVIESFPEEYDKEYKTIELSKHYLFRNRSRF